MFIRIRSRDTDNAMLPRQITHQNIFRVLIAGFSLVILLLVAAAVVGVRNIQPFSKTRPAWCGNNPSPTA
jgi:hypothetical protein